MPATGRGSRPLPAEGNFFADASARNGPFVDFSTRYRYITAGSWGAFGLFSFEIETDVTGSTPYTPYVKRVRVSTSLATGPTSFNTWTWSGIGAPIVPGGGSWSCSTSGVEVYDEITFSHQDNDEWLGETQHHNLKECRVYVMVEVGTPFAASIEINGLTVAISGTCTVPKALMPGSGFGFGGFIGIKPLWLGFGGGGGGTPESASCFLSADILGVPIGAPHTEHIPKGGYATGSRPSGIPNAMDLNFTDGIEVTVTADASNNGFSQSHEGGELVVQLPTEYVVGGAVRAMSDLHADTFEGETHSELVAGIDTLSFDPTESLTVRRRYEEANYRVLFGPFTDTENLYDEIEGAAISANLFSSSCTVAKEQVCTRLLPRTWEFDGIALRHNARHVLDPCTSATGWANATLSGGHLEADTAVNARPKRTFAFGEAITQAYRYLVVDLVSPVGGALISARIETPSGTYTLRGRAGDAGVETPIVFDLCALPLPGPVDMKHLRWPAGNSPFNAFAWGIDEMASIELRLPADSGVYEIHEVRLERFNPPRITLLNAENPVFVTGDPADGVVYPFIIGEVDGRRALEFYALSRAGDGSPTAHTLADLQAWVTVQYPGWEVELIADGSLPLVGLGGAGFANGESWIRRQWDQDEPIPYVKFYAGIRVPPASGDVWSGGGFGGATPFAVQKILGGGINGLALTAGRKPAAGAEIKLESLPSLGGAGSGTADSIGRYATASPWGRSALPHRATCMRGESSQWPSYDLYTPLRTDRRLSFIAGRIFGNSLSYDRGGDQTHFRAFVADGTAWVGIASNGDLATWDDVDAEIEAEHLCLALDVAGIEQRLLLAVSNDEAVSIYVAGRDREFTMALELGPGTFPSIHALDDQRFVAYWLDGGDIKGSFLSAALQVIDGPFTAISGVADETSFDVDDSDRTGGGIRFVIFYKPLSGAPIVVSSIDGKTFA